MYVIRPVAADDLAGLLWLAESAGIGLTTLPLSEEALAEKITASAQAFSVGLEAPVYESYLLVLEDISSGRIVGTTGLLSRLEPDVPFYSYKVSTLMQGSAELGIRKRFEVLHLVNDYQDVAEICTLFLHPDHRRGGNGKLLSRCRFLLMAEQPQRFCHVVIAEMRGKQDEEGRSPFWKSVGGHFFEMEFSKADYLTAVGDKQFIADLMPKYPLYVPLLPPAAQAVIGKVHEATAPAQRLLEREGFRYEGYVDIFDAGPTLQVPLSDIRTVRESRRVAVTAVAQELETPICLIARTDLNFRACLGPAMPTDDGVVLTTEVLDALQLELGDSVRYIGF